MLKTKSYEISKHVVVEAYKRVKDNRGAAGIDDETLAVFEKDLKNNLYRIWNRMSSGSYFPPPVKAVEIPKKNGGTRILGVPTVSDRIAQMVVKIHFEPLVESKFHNDSYGYRPNKSAIDALRITRERCWKYNWVLEFDIKGLFDNIDHELLMKAVFKHTKNPWVILYIKRWLQAPMAMPDGTIRQRTKGTPQGGVISPILANLFLHYVFDKWMEIKHCNKPFARYADDAVVHCQNKFEAENLFEELQKRMLACKLELHPDKTRIIYCKDSNRHENHTITSFDFLGYTFRARAAQGKHGFFVSFLPGVSNKAVNVMRQTVREWRLQLKPDKSIDDLSKMFNPIVQGWVNYYCKFCKSEMRPVLQHVNRALAQWLRRKYQKFAGRKFRAINYLREIAIREPKLFVQWQAGIYGV